MLSALLAVTLVMTAPVSVVELLDPACDWLSVEGAWVTVMVCDESSSAARQALAVAEQQLDSLEREFGLRPRQHVQLVLSDESLGEASGRAYEREGVVIVARDGCPCNADYLYEVTIPHEMSHLVMGRYTARLPVWLREGVAMWYAPMTLPDPERAFTWGEMQYRAYSDVEGMWQWYAYADGVTRFIEREYSLRALLAYLDAHANASIEDALRAVTGFNSAQIMQLWRIEAGLEVAPVTVRPAVQQKIKPPGRERVLAWGVVGAHVALLALLWWWRLRLRLGDSEE